MTDITIKEWMKSHLCLKGRKLMVYAIINSLEEEGTKADEKTIYEILHVFYPETVLSATRHFLRELLEDNWIKFDDGAYTINFEEISRACV